MPRYEPNPTKVTANIEIFPRDDYEMIIGTPKAFAVLDDNGSVKNFGVRIPLEIAEGDYRGKRTVYTAYLHSDGAEAMTKRVQLAALGYGAGPEEEKRFNLEEINTDWAIDTDTGSVGEGWTRMAGARVVWSLDVGKVTQGSRTGEPQQNFGKVRPIGK